MLQNVDDLQLVSPVELLSADTVEVVDRDLGAGTRASDVERQDVFRQSPSTSGKALRQWLLTIGKLCQSGPAVALVKQELAP
jgi:hypothetical protein